MATVSYKWQMILGNSTCSHILGFTFKNTPPINNSPYTSLNAYLIYLIYQYFHQKLQILVLKVLFDLVIPCHFCVTILNFVQYFVTCSKQVIEICCDCHLFDNFFSTDVMSLLSFLSSLVGFV